MGIARLYNTGRKKIYTRPNRMVLYPQVLVLFFFSSAIWLQLGVASGAPLPPSPTLSPVVSPIVTPTHIPSPSPVRSPTAGPSGPATAPGIPDARFGAVDAFANPDSASEAGIGWERILFFWYNVEPTPNVWNWNTPEQQAVSHELAAHRMVVGDLEGTPGWAGSHDLQSPVAVPAGLSLPWDDPHNVWGQFVYTMVGHYKGQIDHWIIWNEPDVWITSNPAYSWSGSVADFYQLTKVAYLAAHAANPSVVMHLTGLSFWWDAAYGHKLYFIRLLDEIAKDPTAPANHWYFDVASIHIYFDPLSFALILYSFTQALRQHQISAPIWVNEMNAPPSDDPISPVSFVQFPVTMEQQSSFMIEAIAVGIAFGADHFSVYKFRDPPGGMGYGLIRGNNSKRPAFLAYQLAMQHFAGFTGGRSTRQGPTYVVSIFKPATTVFVTWNVGSKPYTVHITAPKGTMGATVIDQRGVRHTIRATKGYFEIPVAAFICPFKQCTVPGEPLIIVPARSM